MAIISNETVILDSVVVGLYEVNCYFVFIKESRNLYIIDAGNDAELILAKAKEFDYEKVFLIQTHTHADHISALGAVKEELQPEAFFMHANEYELYKSPTNCLPPHLPLATNLPEPTFDIPSDEFKVLETPGHTKGGICFYFESFDAVFTGDTLFCGSIGRTDLPGGNQRTLEASIKNVLYKLPEDVVVFAGHGPTSTIGNEKQFNPYVRG